MKNKWLLPAAMIVTPVVIFAIINIENIVSVGPTNQEDPLCLPAQFVLSELQSQFDELVIFEGYDPKTQMWKILTFNASRESWTWVSVDQQGVACVQQVGSRGSVFRLPLGDREI